MRIRLSERRDIPAVVGLINQVFTHFPRSREMTEREYERALYRVEAYGEKFVGELDGEVIALLGLTQNPLAADGTALNLTLIVDRDQRGRGYGRRFWKLVEKRLELLNWKRLLVSISAAEAESVEWFARRGLKRVHEDRFFRLDLTDYRRPDDFNERLATAEEAGYVLERVGGIDDLDAEEKLRRLWDIWSAAEADVPHGVSYERLPFERWR
ncbi:MAG: GNAT family N-acetyltransferase, partial [Candidatus Coatesbacteria bacterium]|nr:GNAT family N-acetyltransferase [Candidatus Coatesbacteria bacterium]